MIGCGPLLFYENVDDDAKAPDNCSDGAIDDDVLLFNNPVNEPEKSKQAGAAATTQPITMSHPFRSKDKKPAEVAGGAAGAGGGAGPRAGDGGAGGTEIKNEGGGGGNKHIRVPAATVQIVNEDAPTIGDPRKRLRMLRAMWSQDMPLAPPDHLVIKGCGAT